MVLCGGNNRGRVDQWSVGIHAGPVRLSDVRWCAMGPSLMLRMMSVSSVGGQE